MSTPQININCTEPLTIHAEAAAGTTRGRLVLRDTQDTLRLTKGRHKRLEYSWSWYERVRGRLPALGKTTLFYAKKLSGQVVWTSKGSKRQRQGHEQRQTCGTEDRPLTGVQPEEVTATLQQHLFFSGELRESISAALPHHLGLRNGRKVRNSICGLEHTQQPCKLLVLGEVGKKGGG